MASPDSVRAAIMAVHQAIVDHPDPAQKQTLSQCLQALLKVQASDHQQAAQPQYGPANGGGDQPDSGGQPDPRAALQAILGAGG